MAKQVAGAVRLFQFQGIDLHLHWTWFLVAGLYVYFNATSSTLFSNPIWHALVIITLFAIVTLHEFGHALACRSVGGRADTIVLWPLGGIAFVRPPDRPGAVLWSIAAGPLVNLALVPITFLIVFLVGMSTLNPTALGSDVRSFVAVLAVMNLVILIFNMLPIYPLDGGQVLQSILWFFVGKAKSLMIVAYIGMVGGVGLGLLMLLMGNMFGLLIAAFIGWQAYNGLRMAKALAAAESMPGQPPQ
jgi:Zn-dependent protease